MESNGESIRLNSMVSKDTNKNHKTTGTFDGGELPVTDLEKLTDGDHLTDAQAEKWRKAAVYISIVTIILLVFLGIGFTVVSIATGSTAALGLAFDMMLDSATSMVVLWRYHQKDAVHAKGKEQRAIILLGILFILFAIVISIKSVIALITGTSPSEESVLAIMSTVAAVVMTTLAVAKFLIAKKLHSTSILSDAFSSLMGALISYSILIGAILYTCLEITIIDSVTGIVVAAMLAGWGIWMLVSEIRHMVR